MESGAGPAEQGDPLAVLFGDVAEGFADHPVLLEIMMLADEFVPARLFLRVNQLKGDLLGGNSFENLADDMLRTGYPRRLGWTNHEGNLQVAERFVQSKVANTLFTATYAMACRSLGQLPDGPGIRHI